MTRQILTLTLFGGLLVSSCQNNPKTETEKIQKADSIVTAAENIPFTIAERYFVKNTVQKIENPKIETKEQFDEVLGAAPVMGENGKPTAIDFTKQYVIALTLPETDFSVSIDPVSLIKNEKNEVVLTYKVAVGAKQTYTVKPVLAIIVDKANDGEVVLVHEK